MTKMRKKGIYESRYQARHGTQGGTHRKGISELLFLMSQSVLVCTHIHSGGAAGIRTVEDSRAAGDICGCARGDIAVVAGIDAGRSG
jgi:hypothetical protein